MKREKDVHEKIVIEGADIQEPRDMWNKYRSEDWLAFIRNELLAGESRYNIYINMKYGRYPELEGSNTLDRATIYHWIDEAYATCEVECEAQKEKLKAVAYDRFLDLYKESRKKKDFETARKILADMAKLTGINEKEVVDISETFFNIKLI